MKFSFNHPLPHIQVSTCGKNVVHEANHESLEAELSEISAFPPMLHPEAL
jgi:hypothetical protein